MSTICYHQCDIDDCFKDDWDDEVYQCTEKAAKFIIENYPVKSKDFEDFHICEDCFEELKSEFPDKFKIEKIWGDEYVDIK